MQFDELIKLVREVGNAGLSDFEYREGELVIKMSAVSDKDKEGNDRKRKPPVYEHPKQLSRPPVIMKKSEEAEEGADQRKREVFESPLEGVFWFTTLDDIPCPLHIGDYVCQGQVMGRLDSRGKCYEIFSTVEGEVVNIYIEDGEEIVAREPMFMVASDQ